MAVKIGFAILSHEHPKQLLRLVTTLNAMYDRPPIACHHNFTRCPLSSGLFPDNVRFVVPHIDTKWGDISLCVGALKAFRELRLHSEPEWFFLLSGSDYPVRCADEIVRELTSTPYDALLDYREIKYNKLPPQQVEPHGFGRPDWIKIAYDRYCTNNFWLHSPSRKKVNQFLNAFRQPRRVYGGEFWFQAKDRAIESIAVSPLRDL